MTAEKIRQRANSAKAIVHNELFNEVFDNLKNTYIARWENTPDEDIKSRETLYNRVKALEEIKREFFREINAERFLDN